MIANIVTGKFVAGMVGYNSKRCANPKEGRIISTNNIMGGNDYKNVVNSISRRNSFSNIKNPNLHISLSFHPDDILSDYQMNTIANEYMDHLGYGDSPMAIYRHLDKGHPHLHIVSTQVNPKGKKISDSLLYRRSAQLSRDLELKHNITIAVNSKEKLVQDKDSINSYLQGKIGLIALMSSLIDDVLDTKPATEKDYINRLYRSGVEVTKGDSGYLYSIILEQDDTKKLISGSTIDKAYDTNSIRLLLDIFLKEKRKALPQIKAMTHNILNSINEPISIDDMKTLFIKKGLILEEMRRQTGDQKGMINGFKIFRTKDNLQINLSELNIPLKNIIPLIDQSVAKDVNKNIIPSITNTSKLEIVKEPIDTSLSNGDIIIENLLATSQNLIDLLLSDNAANVTADEIDEINKRKKKKRKRRF